MKFAAFKEAVRLCMAAKVTVCTWGHRGIGKSAAMAQIAQCGIGETMEQDGKKIHLPMGLIDFRCSQIEATDLRGLPDKKDGRTVYLPMEDMPVGDMDAADIEEELLHIKDEEEQRVRRTQLQPHYKNGILFLDEPNRAQDDVLQGVFQLILDRRVGRYVLPVGWGIVMACNYMEGDYITNGFTDAALLNRMCHLNLIVGEETLDDWCAYMVETHGDNAQNVIEFGASNLDHLYGSVEGELGFSVQPSPRSWDMVVRVEREAKQGGFGDTARRLVIEGLVGLECASAYLVFSCPVKPRDILRLGVSQFKDALGRLDRNQVIGVAWGFISLVRNKMNDRKVIDIALDLAEVLLDSERMGEKDVVVAYIRSLLGDDTTNPVLAGITNRVLVEELARFGDDIHPLLKRLLERPRLHKMLASTGWGAMT